MGVQTIRDGFCVHFPVLSFPFLALLPKLSNHTNRSSRGLTACDHISYFPVYRLNILHAQRLSKLTFDMTPFSGLLDDMMQLALYDYEKVRSKAQPAFLNLLRQFPAKVKSEKVLKVLQTLESNGKKKKALLPVCLVPM